MIAYIPYIFPNAFVLIVLLSRCADMTRRSAVWSVERRGCGSLWHEHLHAIRSTPVTNKMYC